MCLYQDTAKTKAWIAKHGHKKSVPVYKKVRFWQVGDVWGCPTGALHVKSAVRGYPYTPGVHNSGSRQRVTLAQDGRLINRGIHAYTTRGHTMATCDMTFRADPKDLIAVGSYGEIVFRKVTLTKQSYDNAIKRWKRASSLQ